MIGRSSMGGPMGICVAPSKDPMRGGLATKNKRNADEFNKKFYELLDAKFKNRDDGSSLFDFLEFREAGSNANMGKVVLDKNYDMAAEVFDPTMLSLGIQPSLTVYRNSVIAETTASRGLLQTRT